MFKGNGSLLLATACLLGVGQSGFITDIDNLGIWQTDAYSLDDLAKEGFISYKLLPEKGRTNNAINQIKHYYEVTLQKAIVLS